MNILVLLSLVIAAVAAIPAYPHAPVFTHLMNYAHPVAYAPEARRTIPDFVDTATTTTQSVASWQLKQLRRKWFILICMLDVSCPTITFPEKHPWSPDPFRSYPAEFRIDDMDEEMQHREMLTAPEFTAGETFEDVANNRRAEIKSTNNLVKLAEFQMAQWIWRWNIILCLVNPSCPNVNIPSVPSRTGGQYPPIRVNVEKMRLLGETQQQPRVLVPVSFADE
ncbi:hypothetical protein GHT06_009759 [Daphnia sinensis]|uniref:Uncharacterized protein n=1 Tax=Daphnia sinensis TaxID=1820382 RepID=A0AAD5LNF6_9CRUS|nr:hypothetical protein GHT06_009759 [Daphnia sinensis]